jgi:hypothetical protein
MTNLVRYIKEETDCRVGDRMLRKVLGPNRNEVTGEWKRIHNEELYDQYPPKNMWVTEE